MEILGRKFIPPLKLLNKYVSSAPPPQNYYQVHEVLKK